MVTFTIERLVPKFLLNDRSGFAMAKAMEAALNALNRVVAEGVSIVLDVDEMPEWRLDEMAWELACLYDYGAEVEEKRRWIRDAIPLYALHGTPQALYNYLGGAFDGVKVEEFWQYGGEAHHFRVTTAGAWTGEKLAWALRAVARTKNVRSVLDDVAAGVENRISVTAAGAELTRIFAPRAGDEYLAGMLP